MLETKITTFALVLIQLLTTLMEIVDPNQNESQYPGKVYENQNFFPLFHLTSQHQYDQFVDNKDLLHHQYSQQ